MLPGVPNFFQNPDSFVLLNFWLWAKVASLHPAQILKSQHMIALKIFPAHVRLMFSTKNRVFSVLAISRSCPRLGNNHIGNMLQLGMSSLSPKKDNFNKPHLHWNAENTFGHRTTYVFCCHSIISFGTDIIKVKDCSCRLSRCGHVLESALVPESALYYWNRFRNTGIDPVVPESTP